MIPYMATTTTVTRTKTHFVIKIPIAKTGAGRRISIDPEEKRAISDGFRAIAEGRASKPLKTKREILSFLRKI